MSNTKKGIVVVLLVVLFFLLSGRVAKAANTISPDLGAGTNKKSFLGRNNLPRGIRNNNPGNLKITNPQQGWMGSIDASENKDGVFEQFLFYTYGLRAMLKLIQNKIRAGDNTIRKLIRVWAPSSENDTEAYIRMVEQETGILQNLPLFLNNKEQLFAIAKAIEQHENGMSVMTEDDFNQAYNLI